ncbi:VanZ family protein [Paenibacillus rhizoplanae]
MVFLPMVFTRLRSFSRTAFAVFATSFSIEFIQYFLGATADIDDIILNFCGRDTRLHFVCNGLPLPSAP